MSLFHERKMQKQGVKKEGFWYWSGDTTLPMPVANETSWEGQQVFINKLKKLESKAEALYSKGFSTCRICQKPNGSIQYIHGGWTWPEGFLHYVEEHNVKPSEEFLIFVLNVG